MSVEAKALFLVTGALTAFGLAVLYSASSFAAEYQGDESTYFLSRQLAGVAVGGILLAIASKIDADRFEKWAWPLMFVCLFLMLVIVLPFTPEEISPTINRSRRFIRIPGLGQVQPSELCKLAVIVWTSMLVVKKGDQMRHLLKGLTPFLIVVGALAGLAAVEPDISIAITFFVIMGVILFASGARVGHFLFLGVLGTPAAWYYISQQAYVMRRLDAILHPGSGIDQLAPQLRQTLIGVGSGRLIGRGFGEGMQQAGWVPLGYNDFVGGVIGEEFGFIGMLFILLAFCAYGYLGYRISQNARSRFQQFVAVGITFTVVFTALVHLGVVVGLLPTTGLTLPFVSYGRSNLLLSLLMTGILINIGSTKERVYGDGRQGVNGAAGDGGERIRVVSPA
jgi:cell division protein FtsW